MLRQRYLTGGEALLNEWNTRFLASRNTGSARHHGRPSGRSLRRSTRSKAAGAEGEPEGGEEEAVSGRKGSERSGGLRSAGWASQLRSILDVSVQVGPRPMRAS